MPRLTSLEELDVAIGLAATDADSSIQSLTIAREFYSEYRELVAQFSDQWIIEKLATLIAKHRTKARRESNQQLVFEVSLGFKRLPKKIELKPGESVPRSQATVTAFRKLAAKLRKEESPALVETLHAIELMQPYTKGGARDITWGEVIELEAKKAAKKK